MAGRNGVLEYARGITRQARGKPGWLENIIWHTIGYILTNIIVTVVWIFFRIFQRVTTIGRKNVGHDPNTVLLSNHQSMIDSFPVGLEAYFPWSFVKPYLIPWNPAASENFFKHPLLGFMTSHMRCIPVRPGRRDLKALHRMIHVLPTGTMTLFPEGTRSRSGEVGPGRPGAGLLILATRPRVIPVAIEGMQDVLPIGSKFPRLWRRVRVMYGKPVDYSEFLDQPRTRETAQEVVDKVMEVIRAQHSELRRLREMDHRKRRTDA
jgi:1-acyl-sn-glycerol-3-phosphate acyltransferase